MKILAFVYRILLAITYGVLIAGILSGFAFFFDKDLELGFIGFLLGFVFGFLRSKTDVQCPMCDTFFKSAKVQVGCKIISQNIVQDIKHTQTTLGEKEVFYKCAKCGYEWSEIRLYEEKDSQKISAYN